MLSPSTKVRTALPILWGVTLLAAGCKTKAPGVRESAVIVKADSAGLHINSQAAEFVLLPSGYLRAILKADGSARSLDDPGNEPGQQVTSGRSRVADFVLDLADAKVTDAAGKLGTLGKRVDVSGRSASSGLDETLTLEVYDDFPAMALLSAAFRNTASKDVAVDAISIQRRRLSAQLADPKASPHQMWSFHGSSLKWGKDEILPIPARFSQENAFGAPVEVESDLGRVGGGIPVVAFWTRGVGEAIGHIETAPLVLSIPVETAEEGRVLASVTLPVNGTLKPGEVYATPRTFVSVYKGDYYEPLSLWSKAVEREGMSRPSNNDEDYAVSWCGWGYEFGVTPKQMLDTVPKLKELGIHWATLDDGWFTNYGDWQPRPETFPGRAVQNMVRDFHAQGIKVQLWWLPLAVEDGRHGYGGRNFVVSDVLRQHPDWLILNEHGQAARMARNLAALCPALPEVRMYYQQLTERFIRDWGFDGHKLDNIYTAPPCYNPGHHHKSPNDSIYAMGEVYRTIFETTRALKPDSVTQICPCGTPPSLAWLDYMDQAVTADPVGSVQVRRRIKMYKALLGPHAAIYGDHVELTKQTGAFTEQEQDIGDDFASTLGAGGVLGTKFTWPDYGAKFKSVYLGREKEAHWKKWIALYNEKRLSKGEFLNLYVYGYDSPEAYAIEKDGKMYYAFYAHEWASEVELRGLTSGRRYRIVDYVNNRDYGVVVADAATKMKVEFRDSLLLEASQSLQ